MEKKIYASLYGVLAMVSLVWFVLTLAVVSLVVFLISAICMARTRKAKKVRLFSVVFGLFFLCYLFLFSPIFLGSSTWQWPIQRWYAEQTSHMDLQFIPTDFNGEVQAFTMKYIPPMMQGSGMCLVSVTLDAGDVASYVVQAKASAVEIFTTSAYEDGLSETKYLSIPEMYRASEDWMVYVFYSNQNWNHAHSRAMLINEKENTVCWLVE